MTTKSRMWCMACAVLAVMIATTGIAGETSIQVFKPSAAGVTPPMRDVAVPEPPPEAENREVPNQFTAVPPVLPNASAPEEIMGEARITLDSGVLAPAPSVAFDSINSDDNADLLGFRIMPPDTEGAVGPNHYIQYINLLWAVYDKSGALELGPLPGNSLWAAGLPASSCAAVNDGDPIVLYDHGADRWLMSQFALPNYPSGPFYQCLAVSQSGDPTGSWYVWEYEYSQTVLNDYPKFGVWPDGYYMTINEFGSAESATTVFDRLAMIAGDMDPAAQYFYIEDVQPAFPQPTNWDGGAAPPEGAPNYNLAFYDDAWGNPADIIQICEFQVDWETPANSTFTCPVDEGDPGYIDLTAAGLSFDSDLCGYARNCIPQPNGQAVDSLSDRFMFPANYRNLTDTLGYEVLTVTHSVDADDTDRAGVRWYELRNTGGGWFVFDGGTFAPDDGENRWMGSSAVDKNGNIGLVYSISSSSTFPSVGYTARLATDPPGTMQTEVIGVSGGGSQSGGNRWGDYASMHVDPDGCTFWGTAEYAAEDGSFDWDTYVVAFSMPGCTPEGFGTLEGTVINSGTMGPIEGARVAADGYIAITDSDGFYSLNLPVGTYDVTATLFGFSEGFAEDVEIVEATTTTQDFELTPTAEAGLDGFVTGEGYGWPLYARVEFLNEGVPVAMAYTNPFNGYYETLLPISTPYEIMVYPMIEGYDPASREIVLDPAGQTESFVLSDNGDGAWYQCQWVDGIDEDFNDETFPPPGWEVINNGGDCVWDSAIAVGRGNLTAGDGDAAAADSDLCGFGSSMDTTLVSPSINLSDATSAFFSVEVNYNDLGSSASIDVSLDGGATWLRLATFDGASYVGPVAVDLTGLIDGVPDVKFRFNYAAGWDWWFQVDDLSVTTDAGEPFFGCEFLDGGLASGFVSDANSGEGMVGAEVGNDLGGMTFSMATPDDPNLPDGYYYLFTPMNLGGGEERGPSTRTFYAAESGYGTDEVTTVLTPSSVTQINFNLEAGWLELVPDFLVERLNAGATSNQGMEVINYGGLDAEVRMITVPIPATWDYSAPELSYAPGQTEASAGPAPGGGTIVTAAPAAIDLILAEAEAFGVNLNAGILNYWPDVNAPDTAVDVSGGMGLFFAGDFLNGDFSTLYVIDYATSDFLAVDTATGGITAIGTSLTVGGESWTGMTGAVDGTMYASSTNISNSTLYSINMSSGEATPIGSITGAPCIIDIAINAEGALFGVDICSDVLVQIDPGTGAGTVIGPLGADANFAQGMDFDEVSGTLYWAAYTAGGELRVIDTTTGASTLVGGFPGGIEVDAFAIATYAGGGGLPWLVLTPEEGTATAMSSLPIDAEFIADEAPHYGLHRARVSVSHDTPYDVNDAGVCFTKAFNDVGDGDWFDETVHATAGARITGGCGLGEFCPTDTMLRHVMARWLLKLMYGPDYSPPPCQGIFGDVVCESTPNADWIEQLYAEGVTGGCSADPLLYCPFDSVTRAQMAVFIIRAIDGPDYEPAACAGIFGDVSCPDYWAVDWIEDLYARGITAGCSADPLLYCPEGVTSRAEMATFVQRAWELPMCEYEE